MKKDKRFIIMFLGIILTILILYPINFVLIKKGIIVNNYASFYVGETSDGNIFNKVKVKLNNIKGRVNTMIVNYFPLYNGINYYYQKGVNAVGKVEYGLLGLEEMPTRKNSDNEYIVKNFNDDFYYVLNNLSIDELNKRLDDSISLYEKLAKNVDLYIYLPNRYEFTGFSNSSFRDFAEQKEEFIKKASTFATIDELKVNNKEEYLSYYYHTDHHWKATGAIVALNDILHMMDLPPVNYEIKKKDDITMHGSMAKSSGDSSLKDTFEYIDTPYEILKDKEDVKPLEVLPRKNIFYDYYVGFFDGQADIITYDYDNGQDNLLIIGDSMAWSLDYLIAEHFNRTFTINPRYLKNFNYEDFIKENNITKVLILMENQTIMFDQYNYNLRKGLGL